MHAIMSSRHIKGYVMLISGGLWFGSVVFLIAGNIILRETPLGGIARFIDLTPFPLRECVFFGVLVNILARLGRAGFLFCAAPGSRSQENQKPLKLFSFLWLNYFCKNGLLTRSSPIV